MICLVAGASISRRPGSTRVDSRTPASLDWMVLAGIRRLPVSRRSGAQVLLIRSRLVATKEQRGPACSSISFHSYSASPRSCFGAAVPRGPGCGSLRCPEPGHSPLSVNRTGTCTNLNRMEFRMTNMSRRQALNVLATAGATMGIANLTGVAQMDAQAQTPGAPAFRGQHQPKPLPFDPAKLNGLSEKLIRSHWENNYQGAVRALNAVEQRLDSMLKDKDLPPYVYADLKREELVRTGSLVLHEYYFGNLGGDGKPGGDVAKAISQAFGSPEQWDAEFRRTANALAGGSGWVILAYNLHTGGL